MLLPLVALVVAQPANTPPTAVLTLPAKPVAAGAAFKATLKLTFADGLHGYQNPPSDQFQIPVTIKLEPGLAKLVSVAYPKGVDLGTPPAKVYSGSVTLTLNLKAGKKSGPIAVDVNYQQCTETNCFPPSVVSAKGKLSVAAK